MRCDNQINGKKVLVTPPTGEFCDFFCCCWLPGLFTVVCHLLFIIGSPIPRGISSRSPNPPWDFKSEPPGLRSEPPRLRSEPPGSIGATAPPLGSDRRNPLLYFKSEPPLGSDLKSDWPFKWKYLRNIYFWGKNRQNLFLSKSCQEFAALVRFFVSLLVLMLYTFVCADLLPFYVFSYAPPPKCLSLPTVPLSSATAL